MKLSIVIVNYNVRYFLEQTLLSVEKAMANITAEVFVVDNHSVDDSVQMVKERFPQVILIENKDNPGFSKANNQAIRQAKGEYILLLNPDTVVDEDTFEKCIAFMDEHHDAGGLGVKMIDGSGKFLPESKRGFPYPFVAFCKTFGLSKLFPKSRIFNRYHLGYLDENSNHEIDVLSGAFMMLRKSVLDKIGLLDESFFMYGEDIDLSYRIKKSLYKNYYFADTTIIHYKGESTKKGSLNYVKVFYNAMIIFAKKHFSGTKGKVFILMLYLAIYFRAFLTLANSFIRKMALPLLDATLIAIGLYFLKDFWGNYYFKDINYYNYNNTFLLINLPLYTMVWLSSIFFSGGYDGQNQLRNLLKGLFVGTLVLAAIYGFLDLEYRSSRMLIILGALWAFLSTFFIRIFLHFIQYKNFNIGHHKISNLAIVGSKEESDRVLQLLQKAQVRKNIIGIIGAQSQAKDTIGNIEQINEIVRIYKIDELIFCSKDIPSQQIMKSMTDLGSHVAFKILPEKSFSIIGSQSKNNKGELYTIDIEYKVANTTNKRNKRIVDVLSSFSFILLMPFIILFFNNKINFIKNIFLVLIAKKTWVAYQNTKEDLHNLPQLKTGVLYPSDALDIDINNEQTIERLNFFYAKDYSIYDDLEIIWKGKANLGRVLY